MHNKPHENLRCSGFTLLEIMVALSIIAIVLVSVYKMQAQTISMSSDVKFNTLAPLLAQKKIAELQAKGTVKDTTDDSGDFGEDFPGFHFDLSVNNIMSENLGDITKDLVRIDIAISFNDNVYKYKVRRYKFLQKNDKS